MDRFGALVARLFRMDEAAWARHASPWSVWTRVATLPVLLSLLWVTPVLGSWAWPAWLALLAWIWLNPRLFAPPASTDTWSAKATFGERVWLNRAAVPIPTHHVRVARLLTLASGAGFVAALGGAWLHEPVSAIAGGAIAWLAKLWFCDRMVWLYEDMKDASPQYRAWLRK